MKFVRETLLIMLILSISYFSYAALDKFYVSPCWIDYTAYLEAASQKGYLSAAEKKNLDSLYEQIHAKSGAECFAGYQRLAWLAAIAIGLLAFFVSRLLVGKVRYSYIFIAVTCVTIVWGFFVLSVVLGFFSCLSAFALDHIAHLRRSDKAVPP